MATQDAGHLLEEAFEAQRRNRNIGTRPEYRMSGFEEINGSQFRYPGELPKGVKELRRYQASVMGQGEPYLIFDEPLDTDLMEQCVREAFGRRAKIERGQRLNSRRVKRLGVLSLFGVEGKLICDFGQLSAVGNEGLLEYYTDTSSSEYSGDTPRIIEAVRRYLARKHPQEDKEAVANG